jgi:Ca-activated chloride channel family protein
VLENGRQRPIVDFKATDRGVVSVAVLLDTSGSMRVGSNLEKAKEAVHQFVSWIEPARDEVALFTFDKAIRQEVPFTSDSGQIRTALDRVSPWGLTSLHDAIAETAKRLGDRPFQKRAVVVVTDGMDTSSTLTPPEVSALASAIDVPVYVLAVVSPLHHPARPAAVVSDEAADGDLSNLAYWTGGYLASVSAPGETSVATRELVTELRQQYVLAIESATVPGWYRLEVKTRRPNLSVRARSGYFATHPVRIESTADHPGRPLGALSLFAAT